MWNHHCQQVAQRLDQMVQVQNQDVSGQSLHWNRKIQPEKNPIYFEILRLSA